MNSAWMIRHLSAVWILLACFTTLTAGEKTGKRPITLEDLWKAQRLGKPSISPDGQWVAVDVATNSMDDNASAANLWLLAADGKTQKQLTTFKGSSTGPVWSPVGDTIAFVSKRSGDVPQIQVISPTGGEAREVSHLPMAPSGLKWSADGASYRKKEKTKKDDQVQAYIIEDALYRVWDRIAST